MSEHLDLNKAKDLILEQLKEFTLFTQSGEFLRMTEKEIEEKVESLLSFLHEEEKDVAKKLLQVQKEFMQEYEKYPKLAELSKRIESYSRKFAEIVQSKLAKHLGH